MENYVSITTLSDLQDYLAGQPIVAFDFETAPDEPYRDEARAALDPHKAHITGVSLPVSQGGTHDRGNLMSLCQSCHTKIHHEIGDRQIRR